MNTKLLRMPFVVAALLALSIVAAAQAKKPLAYAPAPKLVISKLMQGGVEIYDVRGKVAFTVTGANTDDTVTGTLVYTIEDAARQKIAATSGQPLEKVAATITKKDIIASFQKGTAYPIVHLEFAPMDVDHGGAKINFKRFVIDVPGREPGTPKTGQEEMEMLFSNWAKQINAGRQRRGIISAMNRLINGEEDPNQAQPQ